MIGFRSVATSDLPQLREIASTAFKHHRYWLDGKLDPKLVRSYYTWDLEKLVTLALETPSNNNFIVAEEEGTVVGYIALRMDELLSSIFGCGWGVIASFALKEGHRGKGLGQEMLMEAFAWFKQRGASRIDVWTDSENIPAIQCYEKAGFKTIYSGLTLTLDLTSRDTLTQSVSKQSR